MNPDTSYPSKETALEIAKRLITYKVTNDLDIISSVVDVCKEDVVAYLKKPDVQNKKSPAIGHHRTG
ncbi:hypothetical protein [Sutcliffiella horikoshii]|uniref:hypothetical protein n=1 Tax=Sutcliffiella horikoshii TaxID=79883 RepID=UPI001F46EFCD|nr:hypothetical protein [Sutcliffiella horikoshii]MCG1022853.1 hypothetical protein [Sutcliffiella horikoshii]